MPSDNSGQGEREREREIEREREREIAVSRWKKITTQPPPLRAGGKSKFSYIDAGSFHMPSSIHRRWGGVRVRHARTTRGWGNLIKLTCTIIPRRYRIPPLPRRLSTGVRV